MSELEVELRFGLDGRIKNYWYVLIEGAWGEAEEMFDLRYKGRL